MRRALLSTGLLLLCGCAESFEPASFVDRLRPVAALVEVEGKPGRANPDPGDVVTVTQHIIDCPRDPDDEPRFEDCEVSNPAIEWRFVACVPIETVFNPPICGSFIEPCEGCVNDEGPSAEDPVVRFQVPSEDELGEAEQVVLQGAICEGEIASQERLFELLFGGGEELNPCANPEEDEGRLISFRIPLEQYEPPNLHPEIISLKVGCPAEEPDCIVLERWLDLASEAPKTGCLNDIIQNDEFEKCIPSTAGVANIRLTVSSESLQDFQNQEGDAAREEIQISWLADDGEFERSFSFIDSESLTDIENNPFESVSWWLPSEPALDGTYVRFNFVIRDGRGGTVWEEHGLCIVPLEVHQVACR